MTYQLTQCNTIFRLADNTFIPQDPANTDYAAYLKWREKGNIPLPAPAPPAPVQRTAEEKLAASGLTVDELKHLLGL